jgi:large conductance mechanosensitive channel
MLGEFRDFVNKGNVMDLAVGVIIGGAFGKIVDSLVNDLLMPVIGKALGGGANFENLFLPLAGQTAATLTDAKKLGPVFAYGSFVTVVINFVLLALAVFLLVKMMNAMKTPPAPAADPGPTPDQKLLSEIRDLLKPQAARAGQ